MKILVVEDEKLLADSIQALLTAKGFETEAAYDGETGRDRALRGDCGLLILDVMLPKLDGCQVAREVRSRGCGAPILMLTAKSELPDRVEGLNAGADYFLPKPFDTQELLACVNALLRRQGTPVEELRWGNTALDLTSYALVCGENRVCLSAKEFEVMRLLMQTRERSLSREAILARVWGYESGPDNNYVEVYVGFLRKKLASIGSDIRIQAIRRVGYHLEVES